jgi:hypothetical protein
MLRDTRRHHGESTEPGAHALSLSTHRSPHTRGRKDLTLVPNDDRAPARRCYIKQGAKRSGSDGLIILYIFISAAGHGPAACTFVCRVRDSKRGLHVRCIL